MRNPMRRWICVCMSVLMLMMGVSALAEGADAQPVETAAVAEPQEAQTEKKDRAEWTVMVYLCGTDLESRFGMATYNLKEIARTEANDGVNVVIETGGAKSWEAA